MASDMKFFQTKAGDKQSEVGDKVAEGESVKAGDGTARDSKDVSFFNQLLVTRTL